ncbi:hypothetical protein [Fluviicola taffensis]|uniref:hypothetical protein n=1 Tax=Fluviicola taffensis TaxID=191579 RepID=UPI003137C5B4
MKREWNRKRVDLIILLIYIILFSMAMHIAGSFNRKHHDQTPIADKLMNPFHYLMSLVLTLIFLSPFSFYFKKVPKRLAIDAESGKLQIKKRSSTKPLNFDLNRITYYSESTKFFCILEIYSEVTTSRGITMNKRFTSIVVPAFGFSWNRKVIKEITEYLKELHVQVEENPQKRTIWEHIYN